MIGRIFDSREFFENLAAINFVQYVQFLFPFSWSTSGRNGIYCAGLPSNSSARYLIFGKNVFEMFTNVRRLGFETGIRSDLKIIAFFAVLILLPRSRLFMLQMNTFTFASLSFPNPQILFIGSSGINNSFVVKHLKGEVLCYSKVSVLSELKERKHEELWIRTVGSCNFDWKVPSVVGNNFESDFSILTTESVSERASKFSGDAVDLLPMLHDLRSIEASEVLWDEIHQVNYLEFAIQTGSIGPIAESGSRLIEKYRGTVLRCGMGHGDFTPWNVLSEANGDLCLIDFEWSHNFSLPGSDLFHFVLQSHNCFGGTEPLSDQNLKTFRLFFEQCELSSFLIRDFLSLQVHYWMAFQAIDAGKSIDHPSLLYFHNFLKE